MEAPPTLRAPRSTRQAVPPGDSRRTEGTRSLSRLAAITPGLPAKRGPGALSARLPGQQAEGCQEEQVHGRDQEQERPPSGLAEVTEAEDGDLSHGPSVVHW